MSRHITHWLIVGHDDDFAAPTPCLSDTKELAAGPDQLREMTCAWEQIGSGEHKVERIYMHVEIMGKYYIKYGSLILHIFTWK